MIVVRYDFSGETPQSYRSLKAGEVTRQEVMCDMLRRLQAGEVLHVVCSPDAQNLHARLQSTANTHDLKVVVAHEHDEDCVYGLIKYYFADGRTSTGCVQYLNADSWLKRFIDLATPRWKPEGMPLGSDAHKIFLRTSLLMSAGLSIANSVSVPKLYSVTDERLVAVIEAALQGGEQSISLV